MFGVNEKPLAPQALVAKPELEMAGRNWMLVEGVEVYSTVQSLKVWRLWVPTTRDSQLNFPRFSVEGNHCSYRSTRKILKTVLYNKLLSQTLRMRTSESRSHVIGGVFIVTVTIKQCALYVIIL